MNLRYLSFTDIRKLMVLFIFTVSVFTNAFSNPFFTNNPPTENHCTTCGIPENLSVLNVTSTTATLIWSPALDACGYTVRLREKGNFLWTHNGSVTSTAIIFTNLAGGKTWEWQVVSNCCDGSTGIFSNPSEFQTPSPCQTPTPTGLNTTNVASSSATLTWAPISGVQNYILRYKISGASNWQTINLSTTTYNLTGLTPLTTYEWQVTAVASCSGTSSYTTTFVTLTNQVPTCGNVSTPSIVSTSPNSACISWTAVTGTCSYGIRCRVKGTSAWVSIQYTPNTQICIPSLLAGTTYEVQVAANCCNGALGVYSDFLTFTTSTQATCTVPVNPNSSNITATTAQICWTGSALATDYIVEYKKTTTNVWAAVNTTQNCLQLFGLEPNTTYQYRISTKCSSSLVSAPCAIATFTTTTAPTTTCGIPTGITCSNRTASTFQVTWSAVSGACSYVFRMRKVGSTNWEVIATLATNKAQVSSALSGTTYEFQIQSNCCAGGASDFSALVTCATTAFCPTPTAVTISAVGNTSATVSWAAAATATSYTVQYKTATATTWTSINSVSTTTTLFGLLPNTPYQVVVTANCPNNCYSAATVPVSFTTTNTVAACDIPQTSAVSNLTTTSCTLNWTAVTGACSYIVRVRFAGTTNWIATGQPTKNTASLTGLTANTNYEWQVLTVCCAGTQSDPCAIQVITTPNSCGTPINVVAKNIKNTSADLSWSAIPGAISYQVFYKPIALTNWSSFSATTNTTPLANLAPNNTYQYYVVANCGNGTSGNSSICTFTTTASSSCVVPTNLTTQNVTTNSAIISWVAPPTACSFKVRYRATTSSAWTFISASTNNLTLNGLTPGTTYQWSVMSICCNNSFSNFSNTNTFTTNSNCTPNDDPCTPGLVTTNESSWSCVAGSNTCATGSNVPTPTDCSYSPNDVWYKVIMPASGYVTLAVAAEPGMNPSIGLYSSDNTCASIKYFGCRSAVAATGSNTGAVCQFSVQGPAGFALWIRVWGSSNTTGNFNLCAIGKLVCCNVKENATSRTDFQADFVMPTVNNIATKTFSSEVNLAPNPTSNFVNVNFDANNSADEAVITVFDLQGKKVLTENINIVKGENQYNLNVENLSIGAYILRVESVENFAPSKLMIQR